MRVQGFTAAADIVGHRVRIAWDFVPDGAETLADVPPVVLRRKLRDYAFPAPAAPAAPVDPYAVYDSGTFPQAPVPDGRSITDLPGWEAIADGARTVHDPVSVAIPIGGRMVEIVRRTISTTYDGGGRPIRQRSSIVSYSSFFPERGRTPLGPANPSVG